jgi:hypothetical protein
MLMVLQMLKLIGQHTSQPIGQHTPVVTGFGKDFEKKHFVQKMV